MEIGISTPALLFPAITLLLLAFTNRYLAIANLIRSLHKEHQEKPGHKVIIGQIGNLKLRLNLIRYMQAFGILSFIGCVLSIFFLYLNFTDLGNFSFGLSLVLLFISLALSFYEIQISAKALNIELSDMEDKF